MGISAGAGAIIGGGISAGGGILSGILGGNAAQKAASQQAATEQQALSFQQGVYGTEQANLNPFIQTGTNALGSVAQLYGLATPGGPGAGSGNALQAYSNYQKTPFYQFPLQQGTQTLQNSGAARGLTLSGGQANALQAYGQGYASQNFGQYIQGLTGLAGLGQSSATSLGSLGQGASNTSAGILNNLGSAQAAGTVGQASGINNALSNLGPLGSAVSSALGANNSSFNETNAFNQGGGSITGTNPG